MWSKKDPGFVIFLKRNLYNNEIIGCVKKAVAKLCSVYPLKLNHDVPSFHLLVLFPCSGPTLPKTLPSQYQISNTMDTYRMRDQLKLHLLPHSSWTNPHCLFLFSINMVPTYIQPFWYFSLLYPTRPCWATTVCWSVGISYIIKSFNQTATGR